MKAETAPQREPLWKHSHTTEQHPSLCWWQMVARRYSNVFSFLGKAPRSFKIQRQDKVTLGQSSATTRGVPTEVLVFNPGPSRSLHHRRDCCPVPQNAPKPGGYGSWPPTPSPTDHHPNTGRLNLCAPGECNCIETIWESSFLISPGMEEVSVLTESLLRKLFIGPIKTL